MNTMLGANNIRASLYGNMIPAHPKDIIRWVLHAWIFISYNKVVPLSQVIFICFSYLWGSLGWSPFSYLDWLCSCFYFKRCYDAMTSQISFKFLGCLSTRSSKLQTQKCVFPACLLFPSSILQVSLQPEGLINYDFGWKICYAKSFSVFCGCCGDPRRGRDWERRGSTDMLVAPFIC